MSWPEALKLVRLFLDRRRGWGILPESQDGLLGILDAILQRGEPDSAILLWPSVVCQKFR